MTIKYCFRQSSHTENISTAQAQQLSNTNHYCQENAHDAVKTNCSQVTLHENNNNIKLIFQLPTTLI